MSVTRLGVSLLNVVATIEKPASHHGTARPETKNSDVLLLARRPKKSDGAKHTMSVIAMTIQSSATRCMRKKQPQNPQSPPRGTLPPDCAKDTEDNTFKRGRAMKRQTVFLGEMTN